MARRPAVFLDRDGVVNEVRMAGDVASCPRDVDELDIPAGTGAELGRLKAAGFVLIVVSNQPDVARGDLDREAVERINEHLAAALGIDAVYWCPHDNADGCTCRKPLPGLILEGARDWDVDLGRSCLIGDRWVDLAAAEAAGIDGILLESPHSWAPTSRGGPPAGLVPTFAGTTLAACVDHVLASSRYGVAVPTGGRGHDVGFASVRTIRPTKDEHGERGP
jgi:D-glycero-D-manno-heptose 1,7-bisphosphate phosphatase